MKRTAIKIAAGLLALIAALAVLLVGKAATKPSLQVNVEPSKLEPLPGAAERLARSVQFRTVSNSDPSKTDMETFASFNDYLATSFPRVSANMQRELIAPCSVAYTWKGEDADLRPVLLTSHTDVVPVEQEQLALWTHGPFSGDVADGQIWGRGTLDDKIGVLGLLEGAEALLTTGHKPKRTLVFAFGCDEEVGGEVGAKRLAAEFGKRGQTFEFVFDEGLAVVQGYVPGTSAPVALVGIVEKGFATYTLEVTTEGGHSSMPPAQSAIGILSAGIAKLEADSMPATLNPASRMMFETLAPDVDFGLKVVFSNLWLLEPVLVKILAAKPSTNAAVRTTTAVTVIRGGVQDNVLPKKAVAKVNFRLAPGDTLEGVRDHIVNAVDDERIEVVMPDLKGFANPASKISDPDTDGFRAIRDAVRASLGNEVLVAPASTTGGTDARHYEGISDNQYRFAPLLLKKASEDTSRIHGTNERIAIEDYENAVSFYAELLSRL